MFDPYIFDYKSHLKEYYNISESPNRINSIQHTKQDARLNSVEAVNVIQNDKLLGDYKYSSFTFNLYQSNDGDHTNYYLMETTHPFIYLYHSAIPTTLNGKCGIISDDIWEWKSIWGLARYWIFDYILTKYDFIMSSTVHTTNGEKMWKQLIIEALSKNMDCGAILNNNYEPFSSKTDLTKYYDSEYKFIIYKK